MDGKSPFFVFLFPSSNGCKGQAMARMKPKGRTCILVSSMRCQRPKHWTPSTFPRSLEWIRSGATGTGTAVLWGISVAGSGFARSTEMLTHFSCSLLLGMGLTLRHSNLSGCLFLNPPIAEYPVGSWLIRLWSSSLPENLAKQCPWTFATYVCRMEFLSPSPCLTQPWPLWQFGEWLLDGGRS